MPDACALEAHAGNLFGPGMPALHAQLQASTAALAIHRLPGARAPTCRRIHCEERIQPRETSRVRFSARDGSGSLLPAGPEFVPAECGWRVATRQTVFSVRGAAREDQRF